MKVLVFSDVHGDQSLTSRIRQLSEECDLIICCGDITPSHGSTLNTARQIGKFANQILTIPGNFETPNEMEDVCEELGWTDLHGKSVEIHGLTFFGCGGGNVGPFNTPYELSEDQFRVILAKFSGEKEFIFISHCPPKGYVDKVRSGLHVGSEAVAEFVRKQQPVIQFCGHIHEEGGKESSMSETRIYNVARQVKIVSIE
jgi:hypothetical protein